MGGVGSGGETYQQVSLIVGETPTFKTVVSPNIHLQFLTKWNSNQFRLDNSLQQMRKIVVRRDHSFRGQDRLTCGGDRAFVPPGDNVVSLWTLKLPGLALRSSVSISACPLFYEQEKGSTCLCNSAKQVRLLGCPLFYEQEKGPTCLCNSAKQVRLLGFRNLFSPNLIKTLQIYWSILNSGIFSLTFFFSTSHKKCSFKDGNMLIEIMYINQHQSLVTKCISNHDKDTICFHWLLLCFNKKHLGILLMFWTLVLLKLKRVIRLISGSVLMPVGKRLNVYSGDQSSAVCAITHVITL